MRCGRTRVSVADPHAMMRPVNRVHVLDPTAYTPEDLAGTVAALGPWWSQLVDGRDEAEALVVNQAAEAAGAVATLAGRLGLEVAVPPEDDLELAIAWLSANTGAVETALRRGVGGAEGIAAATEAVVVAVDDLLDASDRLRAAGVMPGSVTGVVTALHRNGGGVPKDPVDEVTVQPGGVVGDRQAARRHHGRPWQALCLWSQEVVDAFAADGHQLAPGRAGENVTTQGLPWPDVRSGVRLRLGEVLVEVTVFSLPCSKNAQWFIDGRFDLMHHERGPVSRVYAAVLEPGRIRLGDAAVLEPDALFDWHG